MLESNIEKQACGLIQKQYGIQSLKLRIFSKTGYPDRLFLVPGGKPLFIEFKRLGEVLRPKQEYVHKNLKSLGYAVCTCDSEQEALWAIERMLKDLSLI